MLLLLSFAYIFTSLNISTPSIGEGGQGRGEWDTGEDILALKPSDCWKMLCVVVVVVFCLQFYLSLYFLPLPQVNEGGGGGGGGVGVV